MSRPPPKSTLFPHSTLSRSVLHGLVRRQEPLPAPARVTSLFEGIEVGLLAAHVHHAVDGRGPAEHAPALPGLPVADRKSTRLNSSHANISYAVFCLKKKKKH